MKTRLRRSRPVPLLVISVLIVLASTLGSRVVLGDTELVYNGGFESGTTGWDKYPSGASFQVTGDNPHGGSYSAVLDKTTGTGGYIYIIQKIAVNGGQSYTLSGYAYGNPTYFSNVQWRVRWRKSDDSLIKSNYATPEATTAAWTFQTTGSVTAPNDAAVAEILGYAYVATAHTVSSPVYFDDVSFTTSGPTAVTLSSFTATANDGYVLVEWETASEIDTLGFNLYRSQSADGPRIRLNEALMPSQAVGSVGGASYQYTDTKVTGGVTYYYWLEDVEVGGASTIHGLVSAAAQRVYRIYLPIVLRNGPVGQRD